MSMTDEQVAERIFMLKQSIKTMEDEVSELTQRFASREVDTYAAGDFRIQVGRNVRFDAGLVRKALAEGVITEEQYESILVTKPDSTKAKDLLAPAVYRALQKESTNKVTVTLPKED